MKDLFYLIIMKIAKYLDWFYEQSKKGSNYMLFECFTEFYKSLSYSEFMNNYEYLDTINDNLVDNEEDRMIYHKYFQLKA